MTELKTITASESIVGVMRTVSGVAKRDKNTVQGFNFRGIDAVVNAIGPALREVGGAIVPTVISANYDRGATKNGTPTVEAFLTIAFDWYGTDGGEPIRGVVAAEAMDTSDKATAKAMSVGLRTFLLQTLMLPTDEKDPDAEYHERKSVTAPVEVPGGFLDLVAGVSDVAALQDLWELAVKDGFSNEVKALISARKTELKK